MSASASLRTAESIVSANRSPAWASAAPTNGSAEAAILPRPASAPLPPSADAVAAAPLAPKLPVCAASIAACEPAVAAPRLVVPADSDVMAAPSPDTASPNTGILPSPSIAPLLKTCPMPSAPAALDSVPSAPTDTMIFCAAKSYAIRASQRSM